MAQVLQVKVWRWAQCAVCGVGMDCFDPCSPRPLSVLLGRAQERGRNSRIDQARGRNAPRGVRHLRPLMSLSGCRFSMCLRFRLHAPPYLPRELLARLSQSGLRAATRGAHVRYPTLVGNQPPPPAVAPAPGKELGIAPPEFRRI